VQALAASIFEIVGPLFLILWILAQPKASMRVVENVVASRKPTLAESSQQVFHQDAPMLRPGQMSMFSAYVPLETEEQKCEVRCKTDRPLNNIDIHIPIEAVVEEDVVDRAGKALIPAGTKVVGQGYCTAETSRILSRGKWIFYASDHQITVDGSMWDETYKEGLPGVQLSQGLDQERVKQAIYRDGAYLYVPSQTEIILKLRGSISVQDLPSAFQR
jgi:hypothetical protein